jgi:hypothetical protein
MEDRTKAAEEGSFALGRAALTFVFFQCLVGLQALLAYQDHFLTVSQMQQRGVAKGLPFLWHFGMWGDVFVVSGLAAYLVGHYSSRWRPKWILTSIAIGFVATGLFSWLYTLSGMPEAHVQNHALTAAGRIHAIYMCIAFAVFLQFFLFTQDVAPRTLGIVSVLLLVHVFIGTHMLLGLINIALPQNWYPAQPLRSIVGWITIATLAAGLLWRNLRDVEARAGHEEAL